MAAAQHEQATQVRAMITVVVLYDLVKQTSRESLFGETFPSDSPRLIEVENLEAQVIRMEVHHGSFSLAILPAVKFDGLNVLDRKSRCEVGVTEGSVGHEDAFAVGHTCGDVAPGPLVCQQQVAEISRRADFLGLLGRQLSQSDERGSADQCGDQEVFHGFEDFEPI